MDTHPPTYESATKCGSEEHGELMPTIKETPPTPNEEDQEQQTQTVSQTTPLTQTSEDQTAATKNTSSTKDQETVAQPVQKVKSVKIKEPPTSDLSGYSVVKIEEKHGMFHNAIPVMPLPIAVIFCLLNIGVPGLGTLLCAPLSFCCPIRLSHQAKAFAVNLLAALLQMITFLLIVGWIWSILWGMTMVQLSLASAKKAKNLNVPYYVRRQSSVESQK